MDNLDLRIPIGLFFVAVGLIMVVFGLTSDPAIYAKSLGINVNLYWGIVEVIFGALMIAFGRSHHERERIAAASAAPAATLPHDLPPPPLPTPRPPVQHV